MRAEATYAMGDVSEDIVILFDGTTAYMYMMDQWLSMEEEDGTDTGLGELPNAADIQDMLDDTSVDVNCHVVADIADSQFMPPAGVEVLDMEEYLAGLMGGIDLDGVDLSAYQ